MRRLLDENTLDSEPVAAQAKQWVTNLTSPQTLAVFSPMTNEVDLTALVSKLPHHRWLFPRVNDEVLSFHQIRNIETELKVGAFGIREPLDGTPIVAVSEIDVFFCPGLAFDPSGGRIGRGRGFYDRMLALARPDTHKIGICFPLQLVTNTFPEEHDIKMDEVMNGVL